jgi:hypothetical protein
MIILKISEGEETLKKKMEEVVILKEINIRIIITIATLITIKRGVL